LDLAGHSITLPFGESPSLKSGAFGVGINDFAAMKNMEYTELLIAILRK
jgi:hypothetical protein